MLDGEMPTFTVTAPPLPPSANVRYALKPSALNATCCVSNGFENRATKYVGLSFAQLFVNCQPAIVCASTTWILPLAVEPPIGLSMLTIMLRFCVAALGKYV